MSSLGIVCFGAHCYFACFVFRGVGCIFFEMATGRPFFPGSTVEDQLHLIFKVSEFLGVLTASVYHLQNNPGISVGL